MVAGTRKRFERPGADFDRVAFFSDALFAIAMTLLVVGIGVPQLSNPDELGENLVELQPEIVSFFIGFAVIGSYWRRHHSFTSRLKAIDQRYIGLNLVFLAVVAFIPFPTGLVGSYPDEPVAVVIYAVTLALASLTSTASYVWCVHADLLDERLPPRALRWALLLQLIPVAVFLGSIPVAILWKANFGLFSWLLIIPLEAYFGAKEPPELQALID